MSVTALFATTLIALAASAFFSGAETGILSVSRERILHLASKGGRRAKAIQRLLADIGRTTTTILIGNNIANVSYSTASTALILALIADPTLRTVANILAAVIVLFFGEFMPKLLFSARPLRRTLVFVPVFQPLAVLIRPLTLLAVKLTDSLMPHQAAEQTTSTDEILRIIRDRRNGACLSDFEHTLITKLLALHAEGKPVTKESVYAALASQNKPSPVQQNQPSSAL